MKNQIQTKKVVVNPVNNISVQGRHKQVFTIVGKNNELIPIKGMNKNRESEVPVYLTFTPDFNRNKLNTGLEEQIVNPYKGRDIGEIIQEFSLPSTWSTVLTNIVSQDKITLQTHFEIIDGVEPDYYTSKVTNSIFDYKGSFKDAPEPTYLQKFHIILYDRPNFFEDDGTHITSRQRLAMQLIKNNRKIAESKNSANPAVHLFYISEENETEVSLNKKRDTIKKATYQLLLLENKYNDFMQHKVGSLLTYSNGISVVKEKIASEKVRNLLDSYIMDESSSQMSNIDKFLNIVGLLESVEGTIKLDITYLLQQAINSRVMSIRDGNYIWHSKSDTPNLYKFNDYNKMVSFFINEFKSYNPKDKETTNWYKDLLDEVKIKDTWFE